MDQTTILIRPMYTTDKAYLKGYMGAFLNEKLLARHSDIGLLRIPEEYAHLPVKVLSYEEIDWSLAGYPESKAIKEL